MARLSGKSKQPRHILFGFLVVAIFILSLDQFTVQVDPEPQGAYLIVTSDINSDDIRENTNSVYRIRIDGTEVKRVARSVELTEPTDSRISSVGCDYKSQRLAVAFDSFAINGFYTVGVDGTNPHHEEPSNRPLINGIADVTFMPDSNYVVVSKRIEDNLMTNPTVLMSTDLDDGQYYPVQSKPGYMLRYPDVGQDGKHIAYVTESITQGAYFKYGVNVVVGQGPEDTLIYGTSTKIRSVDWSPDGEWLLADIGSQVFKMRYDGSDLTKLTNTPNGAISPRWSPDGTAISFVARSSFPNTHHLMVMDDEGNNMRKIVTFDREIVNQCWM